MMSRLILCLVFCLLVAGCGKQTGPVKRSWGRMKGLDKVVGNMKDVSYSTGRTQKPRMNANGKPVHMTDFSGKFVWSEYAASWCKTCAWQTPQTKKAEADLGDEIVFLTVMTGKGRAYNDHATVDTAKKWSSRFNLDPERTIAAELWYKVIPEHRFYSPEGHTLFVHVGALNSEQIKAVISFYKSGYANWQKTGKKAKWMK